MKYAANTSVPVEKSRSEIEKLIERYGAERFQYGWDKDRAVIQFFTQSRAIRFELPLPDKSDERFTLTPSTRKKRSDSEALKHWEQACRQIWRALVLLIKAKLEAVESGIVSFEEEFLAHIVDPSSNKRFAEVAIPAIQHAYLGHDLPKLLECGK